jgi:dienelactone hydrolase
VRFLILAAALLTVLSQSAPAAQIEQIAYATEPQTLTGYLCKPDGLAPGKHPAVMYVHGGMMNIIGGAPKESCAALAEAGYIGFAPIRRPTMEIGPSRADVRTALNYLIALEIVDPTRIALMGYSRGWALTFMAAAEGAPIKAALIMASAAPPPQSGFTLADAPKIKVPTFLIVAENDTGSKKTNGQNTIAGMKSMEAALNAAGNPASLIVTPRYRSEGHEMFEEIGAYWTDVVAFLKQNL